MGNLCSKGYVSVFVYQKIAAATAVQKKAQAAELCRDEASAKNQQHSECD